MLEELLRADRLSQVIDHTTAPAFLLGAVAGFLAIMLARVDNLTRRIDDGKVHTVHGLAQVKRRIRLLHWAVFFCALRCHCRCHVGDRGLRIRVPKSSTRLRSGQSIPRVVHASHRRLGTFCSRDQARYQRQRTDWLTVVRQGDPSRACGLGVEVGETDGVTLAKTRC